ncbi:MAG TPA: hypothetical protein VII51_08755 [Gaiellaceae bacterium]
MRLVVSGPASDFIDEQGGRLYVWVKRSRCCGGLRRLASATEPPPAIDFERAGDAAGFELFLPARLGAPPTELHLELRRHPRRVEAYWDGCAWIV